VYNTPTKGQYRALPHMIQVPVLYVSSNNITLIFFC
jgi:hypothetical protein